MGSGSDNRASKPEAVAMGVVVLGVVVVEKSDGDGWEGIIATATEVMVGCFCADRILLSWVDSQLYLPIGAGWFYGEALVLIVSRIGRRE